MEIKQGTDLSNGVIVNTCIENRGVNFELMSIAEWHHARNLVEGATTWSQTKKLLEEFIEMVAAQIPGDTSEGIADQVKFWVDELLSEGRIKPVSPEDAREALKDSLGDQSVVKINIMEREGFTYRECLAHAYDQIKDRKGRLINGTFVKEEDL